MRIETLAHKSVAIYGLGREGRSALRWLRARLPQLSLTVLNDTPLGGEDLAWLEEFPDVSVSAGPEAAARLTDFEVIVKSPGISPYRPAIEAAKARGVVFTSATRLWFAAHPGARTVCVTGTKGKSTTTSLIAHLLRHAGLRVALGGNLGTPLLDIPDAPAPDVWVMELSSYQTSDFDASPTLSLLLNLFPEHTDWHGDVPTYYRDKLNLLACPQNTGIRLLDRADPGTRRHAPPLPNCVYFNDPAGLHVADGFIRLGDARLLAADAVRLPGAHNLSNACAALAAAHALGVDLAACLGGFADFQPLPHRLCMLGEKAGLRYVDDSISTTPQSTVAAVAAFPGASITLLVGGYERHLDWDEAAAYLVSGPVHAVIAMAASGPRIARSLRAALPGGATAPQIHVTPGLDEAVALARRITPPGGLVLLSPGSPSYGAFRNFQERGKAFAKAVGVCA